MKNILSASGILALAALLTSAISIGEMPQDPPRGKKHIQLTKIDDKGNKTQLDTVLKAGEVFVWNGDTIGEGKEMQWIAKEGKFVFDSDMDFDFDFDTDSIHKLFISKAGDLSLPKMFSFTCNDDSARQYKVKMIASGDDKELMEWTSKGGNNLMGAPFAGPKMMMMRSSANGNVIDLSDPGIISFEKKELKDGREKITIIREKPSGEAIEVHEEIMIPGAPMMMHSGLPHKAKTIKVIAGDDGKVEIIEDGKQIHVEEMSEDVKVIEKDGKKIVIRKSREGDEVKVNVEVEQKQKEEK
ncbi:hypothetical protein INQ51_17435 [Maribellus sp. CM-23]|uniref:hypothetical protein n=1 Tax=Maribellus sp. CM-23 TaxID=2781026 RepID=UPI001F29629C|nr:hypothetical protein [Maribellus sp. CM-23]MCE4566106.1 hypothetical protein [Maribellus sp. CM-23]